MAGGSGERGDEVLHELRDLTSLDFDDLTVWLVGRPRLDRRLHLQQHAALAQRVVAYTQLAAKADPALIVNTATILRLGAAKPIVMPPAKPRFDRNQATRSIPAQSAPGRNGAARGHAWPPHSARDMARGGIGVAPPVAGRRRLSSR